MSLERCRQCCEDFAAHCEAAKASPVGAEIKAFPHRTCEDPDCALYDAMLSRMAASGYAGLARSLRNIREGAMRTKRQRQPAMTYAAATTKEF